MNGRGKKEGESRGRRKPSFSFRGARHEVRPSRAERMGWREFGDFFFFFSPGINSSAILMTTRRGIIRPGFLVRTGPSSSHEILRKIDCASASRRRAVEKKKRKKKGKRERDRGRKAGDSTELNDS